MIRFELNLRARSERKTAIMDLISVIAHQSRREAGLLQGVSHESIARDFLGHADEAFKREVLWNETGKVSNVLNQHDQLTLALGGDREFHASADGRFLHYVSKSEPLLQAIGSLISHQRKLPADFVLAHGMKMRDFKRRVALVAELGEPVEVVYCLDALQPDLRRALVAASLDDIVKLTARRTGLFSLFSLFRG